MNKHNYHAIFTASLAIACIAFLGAGCGTKPPSTPEKQARMPIPIPETTSTSMASEPPGDDNGDPKLQNDDIYCFKDKVGTFKDGRVYLNVYGQIVSFNPQTTSTDDLLKNVQCVYSRDDEYGTPTMIAYSGLEITTQIYGPYGIYKPIDTPEKNKAIAYRCDGPLGVRNDDKSDSVLRCETNGNNTLTQYQLTAVSGYQPLTTGGEVCYSWNLITIKKLTDTNFIFMGDVSKEYEDMTCDDQPQTRYNTISNASTLDRLITKPAYQKQLKDWNSIIKSFRVETDPAIAW